MSSSKSAANKVYLNTIAEQAKEIAKLQIEVTRANILKATLESERDDLKARLSYTFKSLLDVQLASTLSLASMQGLTTSLDRIAKAVEDVSAVVTEPQSLDAGLEEMAEIFATFKQSVIDFTEGKTKEYEKLAAEREATEREFEESMKSRNVQFVFVDAECTSFLT